MRIIRGQYGRRRFDVPRQITARPTTDFARENIFNVIENLVDLEGASVVDLFAGTGAISFEMLSRGAARCTSVETAQVQSRFIGDVARKLGCEGRLRLVKGDALRFVSTAPCATADVVFADPPYDMEDFDAVVPAVLDSGILKPGGLFVMEHSAKRDYSSHPLFFDHRAYGSVNFSLFRAPGSKAPDNQN